MTPTEAVYWRWLASRGDITPKEVGAIIDALMAAQAEADSLRAELREMQARTDGCPHDEVWTDTRYRTCATCAKRWVLTD